MSNAAAPLSPVQEGLWFLAEMDPTSTVAYCVPWRRKFHGAFDPTALRTALNTVVARHESLRTTFRSDGEGVAYQHIAHSIRIPLPVLDLAGDQSAAIDALARNEEAGFDIVTGPLVRGVVTRVAEDEHLVSLAFHHLVVDGRSLGVLESELAAVYSAVVTGQQPNLPPVPVRYRDFAEAQQEWVHHGAAAQVSYWRSALADIPPLDLKLPPAEPSGDSEFEGAEIPLALPPAVARAARTLCRQERAAPFMVLLAVLGVLLTHHGRHPRTAIGLPVAGRRRPELGRVVGMFVNMLAIPVGQPAPGASFREVLRQVRDGVTGAYANQDIPFPRVVAELGQRRTTVGNPVFQVMFDFIGGQQIGTDWAGVKCAVVARDRTATRFDLEVLLGTESGVLTGKLLYARRALSAASATLLAEHYTALAIRLTGEPDCPVADVLAGLPRDEAQVLELSQGPGLRHPPARVPDLLGAQLAKTPDAVALCSEGTTLTYQELHALTNRMARILVRHGVGPEDVVGVLLPRSSRYIAAMLAVLAAGAAYLPLDPDDPPLRVAELCDRAGAALVITDSTARAAAPRKRPAIDLDDPETVAGLADLPDTSLSDADRRMPLRPEHAAYVMFTSGSTGQPKGVVVPHAALCPRLLWFDNHLGHGPGDRVLQKTPYGFDVSVAEVLGPLVCGATLVVAAPDVHRDTAALAALITAERITTVHFVPSMLRLFLDEPGAGANLRRVMCSGETLPTALAHNAMATLGVDVLNLYGPTEAAVEVTSVLCAPGEPVTIGRPMPGVSTYVLDERLALVPVGVTGELYLAGRQVARGYVGAGAATAERFLADPFGPAGSRMYRTGDLARWNARGMLEYAGRTDHQVKIGGVRVEPGEVAEVLAGHPAVAQATVTAQRLQPGGDTILIAYLVLTGGAPELVESVRSWTRDRMPARMCPAAYVLLDRLPLSRNGKVDFKALPAPTASADGGAARTPVERAVLAAFAEVLGGGIGVRSDFFVSGGTSMGAIRVVRRLRRDLHPATTVRHVFEAPTARDLAAMIETLPPRHFPAA